MTGDPSRNLSILPREYWGSYRNCPFPAQAPYPPQGGYDPGYDQGHHGHGFRPRHKRKKSWLGRDFRLGTALGHRK